MSYSVKLTYIALLNDEQSIINSEVRFPKASLTGYIDVINIEFNDTGVKLTMEDLGDYYGNIYKGTYNGLIVGFNGDFSGGKLYKITNLSYIGNNKVRVVATNSIYSVMQDSGETDTYYIFSRDNFVSQSKTSFVRRGYAYDSIVDSNGVLQLNSNGATDLYANITNKPKPDKLKYRKELGVRILDNDVLAPGVNEVYNESIRGWLYIYLKDNDTSPKIYSRYFSYYNNDKENCVTTPFKVIPCPLYKDNARAKMCFEIMGDYIKNWNYDYIMNALDLMELKANIMSIKFSPFPPFKKSSEIYIHNYTENNNKYISIGSSQHSETHNMQTLSDGDIAFFYKDVRVAESTIRFHIPTVQYLTYGAYYSDYVSIDELINNANYPKGFKANTTITQQDINTIKNPYILAHNTVISVGIGMEKKQNYTPLELGGFDRIRLLCYDEITPVISKIYVSVDPNGLTNSYMSEDNFKNGNGTIIETDYTLPFSISQWENLLANNKNYYLSRVVTPALALAGVGWAAARIPTALTRRELQSNIRQENIMGERASMQGGIIAQTLMDADSKYNALDNVQDLNGNFNLSLNICEITPVIEIWQPSDYALESMYNDFVERGIELNKYVNEQDIEKYITFTGNKYDKKYYKYFAGDIQPLSPNLYDTGGVNKIKNIYARGVKLYDISNISSPAYSLTSPICDYNVLRQIEEETLNE